MLSDTLVKLTGATNNKEAWNTLFTFVDDLKPDLLRLGKHFYYCSYFNKLHHGSDRGYQSTEKVAIKINLNTDYGGN